MKYILTNLWGIDLKIKEVEWLLQQNILNIQHGQNTLQGGKTATLTGVLGLVVLMFRLLLTTGSFVAAATA